jgi:hypothetical protein
MGQAIRPSDKPRFARRHNEDGTIDLICLHCFLTVGSSSDVTELSKYEQSHACEVDLLATVQEPHKSEIKLIHRNDARTESEVNENLRRVQK